MASEPETKCCPCHGKSGWADDLGCLWVALALFVIMAGCHYYGGS